MIYGLHQELPAPLAESYLSLEQQCDLVAETAASMLRLRFRWDRIEIENNVFDWSVYDEILRLLSERGVSVLAVLKDTPAWMGAIEDPPDERAWRDFVSMTAHRYQDQVEYWEIWNEPNGGFWSGSVGQYFSLLRAASEEIREADPSNKILMGGVTHKAVMDGGAWLRSLISTPGFADVVDGYNWHIYGVVSEAAATFAQARLMLRQYGLPIKPVWITETNPNRNSEQEQADSLRDWFLALEIEGAAAAFYFTLPNWCQEQQGQWCDENVYASARRTGGLVRASDFRQRTAVFDAYRELALG